MLNYQVPEYKKVLKENTSYLTATIGQLRLRLIITDIIILDTVKRKPASPTSLATASQTVLTPPGSPPAEAKLPTSKWQNTSLYSLKTRRQEAETWNTHLKPETPTWNLRHPPQTWNTHKTAVRAEWYRVHSFTFLFLLKRVLFLGLVMSNAFAAGDNAVTAQLTALSLVGAADPI